VSIKHAAFYALQRSTSMSVRQNLKSYAWTLRVRTAPLIRAWNGTYGVAELEAKIQERLPKDFEILMVHSSISTMFPMYRDTAGDLLKLLLRMSAGRTLAMPAFFFGTAEHFSHDYYRRNRIFDVRRTPSQMGLVTELFRRRKGVLRSLHPTHSICALGPLAAELTSRHHLTPLSVGPCSPFGVMGRHNTVILGIGVEYYRSLTQMHVVEDAMGSDFPIPRRAGAAVNVTLIDATGEPIPYVLAPPLSDDFMLKAKRLERFIDGAALVRWKYKGTPLYVTRASEVDQALRRAAERGDTLYVRVHR
jgi:aminoglycoside N3'-acetyltransferase